MTRPVPTVRLLPRGPTPAAVSPPAVAAPAADFVLGRRPALDGLRGVAVLAVLAVHTIPFSVPGGFIGVDLFFVLSGFLITALLVQEHRDRGFVHLGHFYLRRALRLAPALLGMLAVVWAVTLGLGTQAAVTALRKDSLSVLLYFYNWRMAYTPSVPHHPALGPVWSLAVEEQFYLLWPLLLAGLLALRVQRRWIVGLVLLGVLVPAVLRVALWSGPAWPRLYMRTDTRLDGLSAGCLVGLLAAWGVRPRARWARHTLRGASWLAAAVLVGFFTKVPMYSSLMYHGGFTVVAVGAAVLITALLWAPPPGLTRALEWAPLRWVGRISYGTYLWHIPVAVATLKLGLTSNAKVQAAGIWGVALAAGALSHYGLELPFLRLKERLRRGRSRPAAAPDRLAAAA